MNEDVKTVNECVLKVQSTVCGEIFLRLPLKFNQISQFQWHYHAKAIKFAPKTDHWTMLKCDPTF